MTELLGFLNVPKNTRPMGAEREIARPHLDASHNLINGTHKGSSYDR